MTLRIEFEPFDIEKKEHCQHIIGLLVQVMQDYYSEIKTADDSEFNFNFTEFVKDWWQGNKVLLLAYEDQELIGFLYAHVRGNLFTSQTEMVVQMCFAYEYNSVVEQLKQYARQLLPVFKCSRLVG